MKNSWLAQRMKYLAIEHMKYGANEAGIEDDPTQPRFIRITDIAEDGSLRDDNFKSLSMDVARDYMLQEGDVLFARSGATVGKAFIYRNSWGPACYAGYLIRFRCNPERIVPKFLFYFTQSSAYWRQIGQSAIQATIQNVSAERYSDIKIPVPPVTEQRAIVQFLDRQTARLDALIAERERVLELLVEKRRALTTIAVTRGVNPNIALRDSGITWLGEIPAHWQIEKAKWLFQERDERSLFGTEEMLTVSHITGVTPRSEKDVNMFEAKTTEGYKLCFAGDLVINTLWAWMGAMGVTKLDGIVSPAYHVYRPGDRLEPEFVDALVRVPTFAQEVTRYSKGVWSSRLRLYPEGFFEVLLPVPPLEEQRMIVAHIRSESSKIEAVRSATQHSMSLLKERRVALISETLSGQVAVN